MSDNLIIVTLILERGGVVYRYRLVRPTGTATKSEDVPLPKSVRIGCAERIVLGRRLADPEKSERRQGKNDIVVVCALAAATDTAVLDPVPEERLLINQQFYVVYAPPVKAEAVAEEHLERCLALGVPMRAAYRRPVPAEWAFEVWAEGPTAARELSLAHALLHETAKRHDVEIELTTSATYYA